MPYPARNVSLFQEIIDCGGAVVSEHDWEFPPLPYTFRARNRIIAGLARATLIVEAGLLLERSRLQMRHWPLIVKCWWYRDPLPRLLR